MGENELTKEILDYLKYKGMVAWRQNTGSFKGVYRTGIPGLPDVIGVSKTGQFIGIEVKSLTGKLRESQEAFRKDMQRCNAVYIVARSLEDVTNIL